MSNELPETLWLGKRDHQWPIQAFVNEQQAMYWLSKRDDGDYDYPKRLWRVQLVVEAELKLVEPPAYLQEVAASAASEDHAPDGLGSERF